MRLIMVDYALNYAILEVYSLSGKYALVRNNVVWYVLTKGTGYYVEKHQLSNCIYS